MMLTWAGKLGTGCGPRGCFDCPSEREPACIKCPVCDQAGCDACGDSGMFEIDQCPRRYVDGFYWELLRFAKLFKRGTPPIQGGALDQEIWFLECCEFLWSEMDALTPQPIA